MPITLQSILVPKKKANPKGVSESSTFNPTQTTNFKAIPNFSMHLQDIFTNRGSQDSRQLLKDMFRHDPDVSATMSAYLTIANTTPRFRAYTVDHQLDPAALADVENIKQALFGRIDYTDGFRFVDSIEETCDKMRYSILLTGGIGGELVFDKFLVPSRINHVNLNEMKWYEPLPGIYKPEQWPTLDQSNHISLDIANFFVKYYRQNPFEIYSQSNFVSCINTIASRQQVINDLYRIMQKIGYPRLEVSVVEEVLRKNAPADFQQDEVKMRGWLNSRMTDIANSLTNLGPDAAYVHTDAIEPKILNEGGPAKSMDVSSIIDVLNAQNQAALKTMASIIGRGEAGVNTGTVEARIFSLSAQSINVPIANMLSDMFTLAMRMAGYPGYVCCEFDPVEMRPDTELEPQRTMKQARYLENLSLGTITDVEYHMEILGRPPPPGAPVLSGTMFMQPAPAGVDAGGVSPNADPLGRSVASPGSSSAKSKTVKKSGTSGSSKAAGGY